MKEHGQNVQHDRLHSVKPDEMVKFFILDNGKENEEENDERSEHATKVDAIEVRGGSEVVYDSVSK